MCVVFVVDKERPSEEMVKQAYETNRSGAGIAWKEQVMKDGEPVMKEDGVTPEVRVCWMKGLQLEAIQKLCKSAPLPYIAHFRIPTVGGDNPALCHPFPITKKVQLTLNGRTSGSVLFHNGHWHNWKDFCTRAAIRDRKSVV